MPEITDFSKGVRNPYYGTFIKDGKFTVVIGHAGFDEVAEYEIDTGKKTVLQLIIKDSRILVDDRRQVAANADENKQHQGVPIAARVGA